MSPAHSHVEQSRNTLAFATRAKEVTNTAHINMVWLVGSKSVVLLFHVVDWLSFPALSFHAHLEHLQAVHMLITDAVLGLSGAYPVWDPVSCFLYWIEQVVSDKVLVKQLQKEVARLEAELKMPEGAVDCTSSEALLQAKDLQIQKVGISSQTWYS